MYLLTHMILNDISITLLIPHHMTSLSYYVWQSLINKVFPFFFSFLFFIF